ncbi:hypothetical protein SAMN04487949_2774 [Halogranum gelatinilyticum]|uniref:Uncharacterized protein n=1 Tax=Halogranum gelatinilyticum TaxID=660521 RepID=A0A1G9WJG2_9EURY|nr:hypothetical protein [Halogranum gelatinilyticum]SDM84306.1 hypothetical protein SAMN04487949_2774 [Halogranum gelatinilyticum]
MSSTPSLPRALLTGVAVAALVLPFVVGVSALTPLPLWGTLVVDAVIALLVATAVVARHRDGDSEDDTDDGDSVWDLIPDWQYDGRHVESGGLSRGEQEKALREMQERAEGSGQQERQQS